MARQRVPGTERTHSGVHAVAPWTGEAAEEEAAEPLPSLDAFLSRYTSEDNASFREIMDSAMINRSGCHTGDWTGSAPGMAAPRANAGNVCLVYQSIYSGRLSPWNRDSRLREGCLHPLQGKGGARWIYFFTGFHSQPNSASIARKDLVHWSIVVASGKPDPQK